MNELSNRELMALAQEGNKKATKLLFQKVRNIMLISLKRGFKNVDTETIEDIVQESLIKVFKNLHKYKPSFTVGAWAGIIAKNSMIDYMRKGTINKIPLEYNNNTSKFHEENNEIPGLIAIIPSDNLRPDELLENEERGEFANLLLNSDKIADNIRLVARLRFVEDCSYKDIASEVNAPLGTVKAQIHRFKSIVEEIVSQKRKESVY